MISLPIGNQSTRKTTTITYVIHSLAYHQWLHWSVLSLNPKAPIWKWHKIISPLFPEAENSCATRACVSALPYMFGAEKQLDYQNYSFTERAVNTAIHSVKTYWVPALGKAQGGCRGDYRKSETLPLPSKSKPSWNLGLIFKLFLACRFSFHPLLPSPRFWAAKCYTELSLCGVYSAGAAMLTALSQVARTQ